MIRRILSKRRKSDKLDRAKRKRIIRFVATIIVFIYLYSSFLFSQADIITAEGGPDMRKIHPSINKRTINIEVYRLPSDLDEGELSTDVADSTSECLEFDIGNDLIQGIGFILNGIVEGIGDTFKKLSLERKKYRIAFHEYNAKINRIRIDLYMKFDRQKSKIYANKIKRYLIAKGFNANIIIINSKDFVQINKAKPKTQGQPIESVNEWQAKILRYKSKIRKKYSTFSKIEIERLVQKAQHHMNRLSSQLPVLRKALLNLQNVRNSTSKEIVFWLEEAKENSQEIAKESMNLVLGLLVGNVLSPNSKIGKKIIDELKYVKASLKKIKSIPFHKRKMLISHTETVIELFKNSENIKSMDDLRKWALSRDSDSKKIVNGAYMLMEQLGGLAKKSKKLKLFKPLRLIYIPKHLAVIATDMTILTMVLLKVEKLKKEETYYTDLVKEVENRLNRVEQNMYAIKGCLNNKKDPVSLRKCLKFIDIKYHRYYRKR